MLNWRKFFTANQLAYAEKWASSHRSNSLEYSLTHIEAEWCSYEGVGDFRFKTKVWRSWVDSEYQFQFSCTCGQAPRCFHGAALFRLAEMTDMLHLFDEVQGIHPPWLSKELVVVFDTVTYGRAYPAVRFRPMLIFPDGSWHGINEQEVPMWLRSYLPWNCNSDFDFPFRAFNRDEDMEMLDWLIQARPYRLFFRRKELSVTPKSRDLVIEPAGRDCQTTINHLSIGEKAVFLGHIPRYYIDLERAEIGTVKKPGPDEFWKRHLACKSFQNGPSLHEARLRKAFPKELVDFVFDRVSVEGKVALESLVTGAPTMKNFDGPSSCRFEAFKLLGRTIVDIRWQTDEEMGSNGERAPVLVLDNGGLIVPKVAPSSMWVGEFGGWARLPACE